jgi:uncharacterized protein (DUF305 family)
MKIEILILTAVLAFGTVRVAWADEVSPEEAYLAENRAAMTKMMKDMMVKPTGDVDRDFVEMMIPHHQGAIDMAVGFLRYGSNEQLKRLAQDIIVAQQKEIEVMRLSLGGSRQPAAKVQ